MGRHSRPGESNLNADRTDRLPFLPEDDAGFAPEGTYRNFRGETISYEPDLTMGGDVIRYDGRLETHTDERVVDAIIEQPGPTFREAVKRDVRAAMAQPYEADPQHVQWVATIACLVVVFLAAFIIYKVVS